MTTLQQQPRVSRGVPQGGQFATTGHRDADVTLTEPGRSTVRELTGDQLAAEALLAAQHHVRVSGLRYHDPKDIAQDTIVTVLEARRRNPDKVVVTGGYVSQIASGHVAIAARGTLRAEDRKAMGILTARVSDYEAETGRRMSPKEQDALAARIRDEWPDSRHKPRKDFVQLAAVRTRSLDAPSGRSFRMEDASLADTLEASQQPRSVAADSLTAKALHAIGDGERRTPTRTGIAAGRKLAWDALAQSMDAPPATPGTLSARQARAHHSTVTAAGGALHVARQYQSDGDHPAAQAFFAPFGDPDARGRDAVCDVVTRYPAYADDLWAAALDQANRSQRRTA